MNIKQMIVNTRLIERSFLVNYKLRGYDDNATCL